MISPQNAERLVKLFVYLGGVASTAAAALFASRVRAYEDNRKAHLEELKQKVLIPLREGLEEHFRPLVFNLAPLIYVETSAATEFREKAKATESQIDRGDILQGAFPGALVFGPLDSALLHDAKENHFSRQMLPVDKFTAQYMAYCGECHVWVHRIAHEILKRTGLPAFPPKYTGVTFRPYVMHLRLAVFVYKRLFRLEAPPLQLEEMGPDQWKLDAEGCTAALGSKQQIELLTEEINKLLESGEVPARTLHGKIVELQKRFQELTPMLDYAIASRKLRKRCDLVPFF